MFNLSIEDIAASDDGPSMEIFTIKADICCNSKWRVDLITNLAMGAGK